MMAYRAYDDDGIFQDYFKVSIMDVVYALITEAELQYGENYQSILGMYHENDEEAFNSSMDDFVMVMMVSAAVASDEIPQ